MLSLTKVGKILFFSFTKYNIFTVSFSNLVSKKILIAVYWLPIIDR